MKLLNDFEQGSIEWAKQRCGKITMSHAKELLTNGKGKTRQHYIMDVTSERLSGQPTEGYYNMDMERGNFLEEWAVKAFTKATGLDVERVGFALFDDERIGCSPDGLIGDDAGIEIKCPKPRQHIRTIYADGINDYRPQAQGNMWICEREHWYMVSFCPWVTQYPIYIKRITRNQPVIDALADSSIRAADEVDELARKALEAKATPLIESIAVQAKAAWESAISENSEVRL